MKYIYFIPALIIVIIVALYDRARGIDRFDF